LAKNVKSSAVAFVRVMHPKAGSAAQEIELPGNTQAFTEAPIYARTSGYLRQWYLDIGAHAKRGQLLAEIETPELDQQLQEAESDVRTAQANLQLRVAVVRNGRAKLVPITIGHDYGSSVEVMSSLTADDAVIIDPSDSITDGFPVKITEPAQMSD
jgi:hypothetical protein